MGSPGGNRDRTNRAKTPHGTSDDRVVTPLLEDDGGTRAMKVLIVEDDAMMRDMLANLLSLHDYSVGSVGNSSDALAAIVLNEPDVVLLDVTLGDEDGRDLLREIRCLTNVPVVFLTGRGHELDRIAGLKMGADDYIVKPFSSGELVARIESLLRRANSSRISETSDGSGMRFGRLSIDLLAREVEVGGELVDLTAKEFDILVFLASSPRQVFSREQLLRAVWNSSCEWQDEATVTEHIRRVRRKIEVDPDHPQLIKTVRGVGYRFDQRTNESPKVSQLV
jgi:DNA-binding response OmpR family regulator